MALVLSRCGLASDQKSPVTVHGGGYLAAVDAFPSRLGGRADKIYGLSAMVLLFHPPVF